MVTTTADLNLHPDLNGNVKIFCSQYDNALREIVFTIYDGDDLADLTGLTATVEGTKPDKYGYSYDATVDTTASTVTVTLVTQMTCVAGLSHAEIVLYSDDSRVGTANFLLMVEEAGISDDTIVSDSVIPGIHDIDTLVEYAQTYADNAEASALEAEGYAAGTQDGTEVESGSTYYQNNAKYYCEHAFSTTPDGYEALVNEVDDILNMIADEWSSTTSYSYGMWLHYDGILYKVIASNTVFTAITPPNTSYYEEVSITDAIQELNSYIGNQYSSGATYDAGDIISHNGYMYVVDVSCTGIEPPNSSYYTQTTLAELIADNASEISSLSSNLTNYSASISQPNLLDNPFFTVNQRGESSYSSGVYTVDRWRLMAADTLTVNDDGTITLTQGSTSGVSVVFAQITSENPINQMPEGTTLTLSADIVSQSSTYGFCLRVNSANTLFDTSATGIVSRTFTLGSSGLSSVGIALYNRSEDSDATITIRSIKLEVGSVSTLANDAPPNYATELAKCQRYYFRVGYPNDTTWEPLGTGFAKSSSLAYAYYKYPTTMRTSPTISLNGDIYIQTQTLGVSACTASISSSTDKGRNSTILYLVPAETLTAGEGISAFFNQNATSGSYIEFTADL